MRKFKFLDCGISFNQGYQKKGQLTDIEFTVFLIGYWILENTLDFDRIGFGLILKTYQSIAEAKMRQINLLKKSNTAFYYTAVITAIPTKSQ